jgi:hypothetical protein
MASKTATAHINLWLSRRVVYTQLLEAHMSRRTYALLALVFVAYTMVATACAESTAPSSNVSADATCDWQSNNTCRH